MKPENELSYAQKWYRRMKKEKPIRFKIHLAKTIMYAREHNSNRKWYKRMKEEKPIIFKKYLAKKRIDNRERGRNRYRIRRREILGLLGNKCVRCGFSDPRALQIDHVNGGGIGERRKFFNSSGRLVYYQYLQYILEKIKAGSKDYQLLCANCNWIKRAEMREN